MRPLAKGVDSIVIELRSSTNLLSLSYPAIDFETSLQWQYTSYRLLERLLLATCLMIQIRPSLLPETNGAIKLIGNY